MSTGNDFLDGVLVFLLITSGGCFIVGGIYQFVLSGEMTARRRNNDNLVSEIVKSEIETVQMFLGVYLTEKEKAYRAKWSNWWFRGILSFGLTIVIWVFSQANWPE